MTIDRLRDVLQALGPAVTPLELAEMVWLAEQLPSGEGEGIETGVAPAASGSARGPGLAGRGRTQETAASHPEGPGPGPDSGSEGDASADGTTAYVFGTPDGRPLHLPLGSPRPGTDAEDVLVPAPQALRHELAIQRALRPLKQRIPDRRRHTLDEEATAGRAASRPDARPWAPVMVPGTDRLLSLALVVDTGPAMSVWRPLVPELREAMQRTGAFRDVRVWHLKDLGENLGARIGIQSAPGGPAVDPAALIDPTGRQVVLVLSDCSGPHWWGGCAGPALHRWARRGPTAVLQPLPERLWRRTAAPAVPGRAIASRAGAPNTGLRFVPHDGRTRRPAGAIPVPVLELAPDWLADWAGLLTAAGDRHRDTAVTYVSAHPAHPTAYDQPSVTEGDLSIAERVMRFQSAASPTAADLAAHVALSVPALPVMRLIQQRVTPGSRPSDLAEVLLSGLLEPVDAGRGLYDFVPGARDALIETLPRPESLAVAELLGRIGAEIEDRAGSATRAFRAVGAVVEGTGSRGLVEVGQPFALVSEEALGLLRSTAIPVLETPVVSAGAVGRPFGEELRRVRVEAGYTLADLSRRVHYSRGHLSKIERGTKRPTPELARMCDLVLDARGALTGLVPDPAQELAGEATAGPAALKPPASVPCPRGLTNLPTGGSFVGRQRELAQLDETFARFDRLLSPPAHFLALLHGMGGVGKSALAREWSRRALARDTGPVLVWWIDAASPATVDSGLVALAYALFPTFPASGPPSPRDWAMQWLTTHDNWLVVLDGATDPVDVQRLLAGVDAGGRFLITSRRSDGWDALVASQIPVDVLELPDAVELLTGYSWDAAPSSVERLCDVLGRLPLALVQAAAWLRETGLSVDDYLRTFEEKTQDLLQMSPPGSDEGSGIAAVWRTSLRALDDPLAKRLLMILAWYAPAPVPRDVLTGLSSPAELARALGILSSRSLIRADSGTVTLHRLVAAAVRTPDEQDPDRTAGTLNDARRVAANCLANAVPEGTLDPASRPRWRALLPHIEALAGYVHPEVDGPGITSALDGLADFLIGQGETDKAVTALHHVAEIRRRTFGPTAPERHLAKGRLAGAHRAAGDVERAVALYEEALAALVLTLADDHPDVELLRDELADTYRAAGDGERAIAVYEDADAHAVAVWGDEHPRTLWVRMRRVGAYAMAEDAARLPEAVDLCARTLDVSRRVLGNDHPDTLVVRSKMAVVRAASGDVVRARDEAAQVLFDCRRVLGDHHQRTLAAQGDLAHVYEAAGEVADAVALYEKALDGSFRALGVAHPETLRLCARLAHVCGQQGEWRRAGELYESVMRRRTASRGPDHPDTLLAAEQLADAYRQDGAWGEAVSLHERILEARTRTLGGDHPDTLRSHAGLTAALREAGRDERAPKVERLRGAPARREPDGDAPH